MTVDIKGLFSGLVHDFENPLAPLIFQQAYGGLDKIGRLMSTKTNEKAVGDIKDKLLAGWPDEEIEEVCSKPEFIMALTACLCTSLIHYARKVKR